MTSELSLASLSKDTLALVVAKLEQADVARLYATNDATLMQALIAPGVCPTLDEPRSGEEVRFASEHKSLLSFNNLHTEQQAPPLFEFEKRADFIEMALSMDARILLCLPPCLTSLSISGKLSSQPHPFSPTTTMASLFPELKRLVFCDASRTEEPVHPLIDQLLTVLPPKLETLALMSFAAIPRFEALPPSLTSFHPTNPSAAYKLSGFPEKNPSYALLQRLHTKLPNLTTLSLTLAKFAPHPFENENNIPQGDEPSNMTQDVPAVLLPHLTALNLQAEKPDGDEYKQIILSLPSVLTLVVSGASFLIGPKEEPQADPAHQNSPVAPQPAMGGFGGGNGWGAPVALGRGTRNDVTTVPSVFPPHLTQLTLASRTPHSKLSLGKSVFSSFPSTLVSLSVLSCHLEWCLTKDGDDWDPMEQPAEEEEQQGGGAGGFGAFGGFGGGGFGGGFGGVGRRTGFSGGSSAEPTTESNPEGVPWVSLLPSSLTELEFRDLPLHVHHLPRNLRSLKVQLRSHQNWDASSTQPVPSGAPGYRSSLAWPPQLETLEISSRRTSIADALTLPSSLTSLRLIATHDWTQDSVAQLLNILPKCSVLLLGAAIWVSETSATPSITSNYAAEMKSSLKEGTSTTPNQVLTNGHLSITTLIRRHLSSLPCRVTALWAIAYRAPPTPGEMTLHLPKGVAPLILPPFDSIELTDGFGTLFEYGMTLGANRMVSLLEQYSESLREVTQGPEAPVALAFGRPRSIGLSIQTWTQLTRLELPTIDISPISFINLPRSLIVLVAGTIGNPFFPEASFDDWKAQYRPKTKNNEPSTGAFGFRSFATGGQADSDEEVDCNVSDLPRGLTRFEVLKTPIKHSDDGEWPPNLEHLHFTATDWTDVQLLQLAKKLPKLIAMQVFGSVVAYGSQPVTKASSETSETSESSMSVDPAPVAHSSPAEETSAVTSLSTVDLATFPEDLTVSLRASKIRVHQLTIPSPLVFATQSTHTIRLANSAHREFKLKPYELRAYDSSDRAPEILNVGSWYPRHAPSGARVTFKDQIDPAWFAQYRSLTSLTITEFSLTWNQVATLPETLKSLSLPIEDQMVVDPFLRCPRFLETLQIDSSSAIVLSSASGISQLPPNLTQLECNRLVFKPCDMASLPQEITTLLFDGIDLWSDLDVFALQRQMGEKLISLQVSHICFSGGLIPLESSSEISIPSAIKMTNERLGPKVKVTWQTMSAPLRLCALDLVSSAGDIASDAALTLESLSGLIVPNNVLVLDLHLAPIQCLSSTMPVLPSALTSLSLRIPSPLDAARCASLPATLRHLAQQLTSVSTTVDPTSWAALPRGLESFSIDFLSRTTTSNQGMMVPKCISEAPLIKLSIAYSSGEPIFSEAKTIFKLDGLPTERLHTLALRPYFLTSQCGKSFGPALRILHCFDMNMNPLIDAGRTELELIATHDGAFAYCETSDPSAFGSPPPRNFASAMATYSVYPTRNTHSEYYRAPEGPRYAFSI